MAKDENVPVYAGIKTCGCVVMVIVDDGNPKHRKRVQEAVNECIADGIPVHRKTVGWARENYGRCEKHKPKTEMPQMEFEIEGT